MWKESENEQYVDNLFLAGERVPSGVYQQLGGNGRMVTFDHDDFLPASLDSRVACYIKVEALWGDQSPRNT